MDGGAVDPVTTRQTPSSPVVAIAFTRYCCCCCLSVLRTSHPNPNPNPIPQAEPITTFNGDRPDRPESPGRGGIDLHGRT